MIVDKESFGRWLKDERECRGISLAAIAKSTKIRLPLLASLERGDLSHWPFGVYRRDFFRQYVRAIGLPAEPLVKQFTQLCPDEEVGVPAPNVAPASFPIAERCDEAANVDEPRLRLATERTRWRLDPFTKGALTGAAEWCVALVLIALVIRVFDANAWLAAALLASVHCVVVVGLGRRAGISWRDATAWRNRNVTEPHVARRDALRLLPPRRHAPPTPQDLHDSDLPSPALRVRSN